MPFQRSINDAPKLPDEPTAKHAVALAHVTPSSSFESVPTFGVTNTVQCAPSQRSIKVDRVVPTNSSEKPTAKQLVVPLGHEMSENDRPLSPPGCGLARFDHVAPSHRCTTVSSEAPSAAPTAKQRFALRHATPLRLGKLATVGVGEIAHFVPFQISMMLAQLFVDAENPVAKQRDALAHVAPLSALFVEPATFGLATTDHALPFQRSTSVFDTKNELPNAPTAKQFDALEHATDSRLTNAAPGIVGVGDVDHALPFQRAMYARNPPLTSA